MIIDKEILNLINKVKIARVYNPDNKPIKDYLRDLKAILVKHLGEIS